MNIKFFYVENWLNSNITYIQDISATTNKCFENIKAYLDKIDDYKEA